jgi:ketosteroid isomerase-like protein
MISPDFAHRFANDWIEAWNSHDLDRILAHYADDFVMSSPRIAIVAGEPSGVLRGKAAIGAYWKKALGLAPSLRFELRETFVGADCIVLRYEGVRGPAAEVFFFGPDGRVTRSAAGYLARSSSD